MAELNDKLITYGNLSTFYDKLQEQGLGGNAIEDASVLPDAVENKDKFFRLSSDDNVYVSELKSRTTTTTNRLPDAQQIDKAYLWEDTEYQYRYVGAYTATFEDGEVSGYGWLDYYGEQEWYFYLTEDDAEHIQIDSVSYGSFAYEDGDVLDLVNKTVTTQSTKNDYKSTLSERGRIPIPATYNAPESAQIGNAYITDSVQVKQFVYDGTYTTITINGTTYNGYKWILTNSGYILLSSKKASDFYYYREFDEGDSAWHTFTDVTLYLIDTTVGEETAEKTWIGSDIYIPQLNAPDSEQVDEATITVEHRRKIDGVWQTVKDVFTYIGTLSAMDYDTAKVETYYAYENEEINLIVGTEIAPSDMYNSNQFEGDVKGFYPIPNPDYSEDMWIPDYGQVIDFSTASYQRTETTEEWDWQPLTDNATNDDIDAMFAAPTPTPTGNKFYLLKASNKYGAVQNEDINYIKKIRKIKHI